MGTPKRICVFSDGSWNDPEMKVPSNIVKLADMITAVGTDGLAQVVFYDAGVGTGTDHMMAQMEGGAFGAGIDRNIMDLYTFVMLNYNPGDHVCMFGYSRGAYTVRSLVGMIHKAGLVRKKLAFVQDAYDLYRSGAKADDEVCKKFRSLHGDAVPIELLVCFDTVGSLGMPKTVPFPFNLMSNTNKYKFHDTRISDYVQNAVHAMSIDEDSNGFKPTPMIPSVSKGPGQVTEKYLPGYHGGVGGGSEDEVPLSHNSLRFVLDEIERRGIGLGVNALKRPKKIDMNVKPRPNPGFLSVYNFAKVFSGEYVRPVNSLDQLDPSLIERVRKVREYRPKALEKWIPQILETNKT